MNVAARPASPIFRLGSRGRRAVLTLHIIASVGLLGDVAAIVAINLRAATTPDAQLAASAYELLRGFPVLFGIPLSLTSLATGLALGLSSKWGVLRYWWVTAKLLLNVSVILVGAFVIGPTTTAMVDWSRQLRDGAHPCELLRRGRPRARDGAVGVQARA